MDSSRAPSPLLNMPWVSIIRPFFHSLSCERGVETAGIHWVKCGMNGVNRGCVPRYLTRTWAQRQAEASEVSHSRVFATLSTEGSFLCWQVKWSEEIQKFLNLTSSTIPEELRANCTRPLLISVIMKGHTRTVHVHFWDQRFWGAKQQNFLVIKDIFHLISNTCTS